MQRKRIPGEKRRELILEAALQVFSEKGYDGSTIKKIADRAGINQGLIYQHFRNKQDLYQAIIKSTPSRWYQPSKDLQQVMSGTEDRKILKDFALIYLKKMQSNEQIVKFVNLGQMENPQLFQTPFPRSEESPITIFSNYLQERMKEGKFKKKHPRLAARIFLGIIHWYGLRSLIAKAKGWKVYNEEDVLDTIIDIFLHGINIEKDKKKKN